MTDASSMTDALRAVEVQSFLAAACGALGIAGDRLLALLEATRHTSPELSSDVRFDYLAVTVPIEGGVYDVLEAIGADAVDLGDAALRAFAVTVTEPSVDPTRFTVRIVVEGSPATVLPGLTAFGATPKAAMAAAEVGRELGNAEILAVMRHIGGPPSVALAADLTGEQVERLCERVGASDAQTRYHRGMYEGLREGRGVATLLHLDDDGVGEVSWRYADVYGDTCARLVAQFGDRDDVRKLAALSEAGRAGELLDLELFARSTEPPGIAFHAHR